LQGVWSSDDMENIPMAAGRVAVVRDAVRACAAAAPGQAPPLYLDEAALTARKTQVDNAAKQRDTSAESSFRFDYARRVFPQTRLIVDPPDGRLPAIKVNQQERGMPRGHVRPGPAELLGGLLALRTLHHARHCGLDPSRDLRQRQPDRPGAGVVAFSTEMLPDTRMFYTDGRKHIGSSIREYLGDSRAHWEGEELVVETTNLTNKTAIGVNGNGVRHSEQMVITERFRRVADNVIQYQATYDDPVTYEKPFTVSFRSTPLDGGVLLPYDCHRATRRFRCRCLLNAPKTGPSLRTQRKVSSAAAHRARRWCGRRRGGAAGRGRGAGRVSLRLELRPASATSRDKDRGGTRVDASARTVSESEASRQAHPKRTRRSRS
jgi:hypothetical protein